MKISYKKLWLILVERDINRSDLVKKLKISSSIIAKMGKNEAVSLTTLYKICEYLNVNIGDICEFIF